VAYSLLADQCQDEEALQQLDYQIGMDESPEAEAMRALREHQEAMGMQFADPHAPAGVPEDGRVPGWMTRDEEF
jgi:hypothetical protein